jgi:hypothetical protein
VQYDALFELFAKGGNYGCNEHWEGNDENFSGDERR